MTETSRGVFRIDVPKDGQVTLGKYRNPLLDWHTIRAQFQNGAPVAVPDQNEPMGAEQSGIWLGGTYSNGRDPTEIHFFVGTTQACPKEFGTAKAGASGSP